MNSYHELLKKVESLETSLKFSRENYSALEETVDSQNRTLRANAAEIVALKKQVEGADYRAGVAAAVYQQSVEQSHEYLDTFFPKTTNVTMHIKQLVANFEKKIAYLEGCHQADEQLLVQRTDEVRALNARLQREVEAHVRSTISSERIKVAQEIADLQARNDRQAQFFRDVAALLDLPPGGLSYAILGELRRLKAELRNRDAIMDEMRDSLAAALCRLPNVMKYVNGLEADLKTARAAAIMPDTLRAERAQLKAEHEFMKAQLDAIRITVG